MRTWLVRGPSVEVGQTSTLIAIVTFVAAMAIVIALVDSVDNEAPFTTFLTGDNWAASALGNGDDLPAPSEGGEGLSETGLPALPQVGDGPLGDPATTSPMLALALLGTAVALPVAARAATASSASSR